MAHGPRRRGVTGDVTRWGGEKEQHGLAKKGNGHICSKTKSYEPRSLGKLRLSRRSSGPAPHHSTLLRLPISTVDWHDAPRPPATPRPPPPPRVHSARFDNSSTGPSWLVVQGCVIAGASQAVQQSTEANLFINSHLCTLPRPLPR